MTVEQQIYDALSGASGVTTLVGEAIHPDIVPADLDPPCIGISRTATDPTYTIHSLTPICTDHTFEVWCMADDRLFADNIADAATSALVANGFMLRARTVVQPDELSGLATTILTVTITTNGA